jgi:hypothetical protein
MSVLYLNQKDQERVWEPRDFYLVAGFDFLVGLALRNDTFAMLNRQVKVIGFWDCRLPLNLLSDDIPTFWYSWLSVSLLPDDMPNFWESWVPAIL